MIGLNKTVSELEKRVVFKVEILSMDFSVFISLENNFRN